MYESQNLIHSNIAFANCVTCQLLEPNSTLPEVLICYFVYKLLSYRNILIIQVTNTYVLLTIQELNYSVHL